MEALDQLSPADIEIVVRASLRELRRDAGMVWRFARARGEKEANCRRLMSVPGIGPLISTAVVAAIGTAEAFERGRDFGAWLRLVPRRQPLDLRRKAILPLVPNPTMWKTSLPMSMPIEARAGVLVAM